MTIKQEVKDDLLTYEIMTVGLLILRLIMFFIVNSLLPL